MRRKLQTLIYSDKSCGNPTCCRELPPFPPPTPTRPRLTPTELTAVAAPYYYYLFHASLVVFCYRVCLAHANNSNPVQLLAFVFGGSLLTSLAVGEVPVLFANPLALPCFAGGYWLKQQRVRLPLVPVLAEYCRVSISLLWYHKSRAYFGNHQPWVSIACMVVAASFGSVLATQSLAVVRTRMFHTLVACSMAYVWVLSDAVREDTAKAIMVVAMVVATTTT